MKNYYTVQINSMFCYTGLGIGWSWSQILGRARDQSTNVTVYPIIKQEDIWWERMYNT